MTSGRLKDLLSHARQSGATTDATRDNPSSQHVASPGKNDARETDGETNLSAEYIKDINDIAGRDTTLSHVSSPRARDMRQTGLSGVSSEFAARLSAADLGNIAAGDIPVGTVQAFEQAAVTRESADLREFFEERSAILEHDGGLPRRDSELEAARITATYARNKGHLWSSLRSALSDYPVLLSQVPNRAGKVDRLPWGVATVAVLKDKRVVRQGVFSGPPEVTP